jgi:peptide/nickel transport system ATP-binding protein
MALQVDDLKVYYPTLRGDVRAVDGVSFDVADGEIMGLAGESGCGKSSLGNSLVYLTGRMRHVGGTVELDGEILPIADFQAMNGVRFRRISVVPQYAMSALNPTRRIGKMIRELLEARGVDHHAVREELTRRLELVGLSEDVLRLYPIELSGGMKQRVVMVLSTLLDPSLLIADEITSALDVSTQRAVVGMLAEFRDRSFVKSMIVITHDISILYQVADTIAVMYGGRIVEKAPADEIIHRPRHPYTRALIAALPEVGVRYEKKRLVGIPGTPPPLLDPAPGCRFAARCPLVTERCRREAPPFARVGDGRSVACWREVA